MPTPLYLWLEEKCCGPYSEEEIRGYLRDGGLTSQSLGWMEGLTDWVSVPQLLRHYEAEKRREQPVVQPKPAELKPVETKPVETVKPIDTAKPAAATKPAELTKPAGVAKSVEAAKPLESARQVVAAKPMESVKPVQAVKPAE